MSLVSVELWATIFLGIVLLLILTSLVRTHFNEAYKEFNLLDIITCQKGKVSRPACQEVGAWLLISWGFVVAVYKDKWEYAVTLAGILVAAFVTRAAHSAWLNSKNHGIEVK